MYPSKIHQPIHQPTITGDRRKSVSELFLSFSTWFQFDLNIHATSTKLDGNSNKTRNQIESSKNPDDIYNITSITMSSILHATHEYMPRQRGRQHSDSVNVICLILNRHNVFTMHRLFTEQNVNSTNNWKWSKYHEPMPMPKLMSMMLVIHMMIFARRNGITEKSARNNGNSFVSFFFAWEMFILARKILWKTDLLRFNVFIHWNNRKSALEKYKTLKL